MKIRTPQIRKNMAYLLRKLVQFIMGMNLKLGRFIKLDGGCEQTEGIPQKVC